MMKFYKILLCAALVSLSGCEEMFYREVDFTIEGEEEMLVLETENIVGWSPNILVRRTFLFGTGYDAGSDAVLDAEVSLRLNGGEWMQLHRYGVSPAYSMLPDSTKAPKIQALDTVEIAVSHPKYAPITARQIMPNTIKAEMTEYELMNNGWVSVTLRLDAYRGNPDDMIAIRLDSGRVQMTYRRTGKRIDNVFDAIYSTEPVFAEALNLQAAGYYGGHTGYDLFFPASALSEPMDIHLIADCMRGVNQELYRNLTVRNLTFSVRACTYDYYLYEQFHRAYKNLWLEEPSGVPSQEGNIMEEILKTVSETLGQQEKIAVYTNVEGGLGYLTGYSKVSVTLPKP